MSVSSSTNKADITQHETPTVAAMPREEKKSPPPAVALAKGAIARTPSIRTGHPTLAQRILTSRLMNKSLSKIEKEIGRINNLIETKEKSRNERLRIVANSILEMTGLSKLDALHLQRWLCDKIYAVPVLSAGTGRLAHDAYNKCCRFLGQQTLTLADFGVSS